eukprot:6232497-Lingulodinium_polyedra.AAC.1
MGGSCSRRQASAAAAGSPPGPGAAAEAAAQQEQVAQPHLPLPVRAPTAPHWRADGSCEQLSPSGVLRR